MSAGHFCWWLANPWSETCFIDMESTAAWLQAVFSVAAIGMTYHLYKREIESTKQSKVDSDIARRHSQTQMVNQLANISHDLVLDIRDYLPRLTTEMESYLIMRTICFRTEEVVVWSRGFILDTLTGEELGKFVNVRSTLHRISTWILSGEQCRDSKYQGYIQSLYEIIENDLVSLSALK
jgi:hypothetical protein